MTKQNFKYFLIISEKHIAAYHDYALEKNLPFPKLMVPSGPFTGLLILPVAGTIPGSIGGIVICGGGPGGPPICGGIEGRSGGGPLGPAT